MNWLKEKWEALKKWVRENSGYQQHEWPPPYMDPYIYYPPYIDPHWYPYNPPPIPRPPAPNPIPPIPHPIINPHPRHKLAGTPRLNEEEKSQWWFQHFQALANHFGYELDEVWFTRDNNGNMKVQEFKRINKSHSLLCDNYWFNDLLIELYKRREEIARLLKVLNHQSHELKVELSDVEKRIKEYENIK